MNPQPPVWPPVQPRHATPAPPPRPVDVENRVLVWLAAVPLMVIGQFADGYVVSRTTNAPSVLVTTAPLAIIIGAVVVTFIVLMVGIPVDPHAADRRRCGDDPLHGGQPAGHALPSAAGGDLRRHRNHRRGSDRRRHLPAAPARFQPVLRRHLNGAPIGWLHHDPTESRPAAVTTAFWVLIVGAVLLMAGGLMAATVGFDALRQAAPATVPDRRPQLRAAVPGCGDVVRVAAAGLAVLTVRARDRDPRSRRAAMTLGLTIVVLVGLAGVFAGTHILALLSLLPIVVGTLLLGRPSVIEWYTGE